MTLIDEATSLIMGPPVEVDVAMPERRPRQTRRVALAFFGGFAAAIVGLFIAVSFHEKPMPEQDFAMRAEPVSSLSAEVLPIYSSVPAVVFGEPDIPFEWVTTRRSQSAIAECNETDCETDICNASERTAVVRGASGSTKWQSSFQGKIAQRCVRGTGDASVYKMYRQRHFQKM
jgi:hypothetical protein